MKQHQSGFDYHRNYGRRLWASTNKGTTKGDMRNMRNEKQRAKSIQHAEYEILDFMIREIDLSSLRTKMVDDKHSGKRFEKAGENILTWMTSKMEKRRHLLGKTHVDYKERE